ncbi:UDP-4-amino-4,6-dideoxy-N-acetyl-beta-L-altrosamine transaminase [Devosia salina]|uniref:UDP-4-amino-4, 6-dideoxy-N-acetyl-beta-L-altrosamine transaminase n=1 Tax=Devosia salina TaxID=2860336 RepID=A0ABX8WID8_9HYPH|nr:UDP-4-amino-4,6-dideoxy-N-acetyl-beta-L-altrosamine transaminase [Devosia salina]QYO77776.1 UDP-4-amino-4,6-dideoxy-N-acetyl-beta-L-altrosamine transaminase [Devosia salina]
MSEQPKSLIPYGKQSIDDDDLAAVAAALRADYLTTGPRIAEFEAAFATAVGAKHAMVCSNGTAALHLSAMALGIGPDDIVLAPTLSFLATANGPHYTGARIVFMDCDPETALVRPQDVEDALERAGGSVKAIFITHMNGQICDIEAISKIARRIGAYLVEDACHAVGTEYTDSQGITRQVGDGAYSDLTNFSLHPVKTITMGEGGVVTTNDSTLHKQMCRLRSHGMTRDPDEFEVEELAFAADGLPNPWYYEMPSPGYNYRATDIQCALGMTQLAKLPRFAEKRRSLASEYDALLAKHNGPMRRFGRVEGCDPVLHLYVALIDFAAIGLDRGGFMRQLSALGIGTQVHYLPIHRQTYYAKLNPGLSLPGADTYYSQCLSLPLYADMTSEDVRRVMDALKSLGA